MNLKGNLLIIVIVVVGAVIMYYLNYAAIFDVQSSRGQTNFASLSPGEFVKHFLTDVQDRVLASGDTKIAPTTIREPFSPYSPIVVWDLFVPNAACPDMERVGRVGDGGKFVCGLSWLKHLNREALAARPGSAASQPKPKCLIYSYGVSIDSTFEHDIYRDTRCEIHAFDPTVGRLPQPLSGMAFRNRSFDRNVQFHKHALSRTSGITQQFSYAETLLDTMARLNHTFVDILKVDVEGSEWEVFDTLLGLLDDEGTAKGGGHGHKHKHSRSLELEEGVQSPQQPSPANRGNRTLRLRNLRRTLPFGQLLIELHFQTMEAIDSFFQRMHEAGFLIFSREINLLPTLMGHKPFAAEYGLINPSTFFRESVAGMVRSAAAGGSSAVVDTQREVFAVADPARFQVIKPSQVATKHWNDRINAVVYFLTRRKRVEMMGETLGKLYRNFLHQYPYYPVVVFHDDLTTADEAYLQQQVPHMPLFFERIQLELPKWLNRSSIPERTKCSSGSSTVGYRHMCMFHATVVHDYFMGKNGKKMRSKALHEVYDIRNVEYVMRMDDDGTLNAPVGYDLFKYMKVNEKKYGFISTLQDEAECVRGLWNYSKKFYEKHVPQLTKTSMIPSNSSDDFADSDDLPDMRPINSTFFSEWLEGEVFYNNFEISHTSIWKHKLWRSFIGAKQTVEGVYKIRWGDAPLHTIGVSMIVPLSQVHSFVDVAYQHDPFVNQRASGLPPPNVDPFKVRLYHCEYYITWVCHAWNGVGWGQGTNATGWNGTSYNATAAPVKVPLKRASWVAGDVHEPEKKMVSTLARSSLAELVALSATVSAYETHLSKSEVAAATTRKADVVPVRKQPATEINGVMYTFGHVGREQFLAETLSNMFDNYAKAAKCDIVVFHYQMDTERVKKYMPDSKTLRAQVKFVFVDFAKSHGTAAPLISSYHRNHSSCLSSGNVETQLAMDFFVVNAVLKLAKMKYNWFFRFADDSRLLNPITYDVFDKLHGQRKKYGFISAVRLQSECIDTLWNDVAKFCNQESQGKALHDNITCSKLIGGTGWPFGVVMYTNFEVSHLSVWTSKQYKWLLTNVPKVQLGELMTGAHSSLPVPSKQKQLFSSPVYAFSDAAIHTIGVLMSLPESEILRFSDINYQSIAHKTSVASDLVAVNEMKELDRLFYPNRFGWLGGDVATSFALPMPQCFSLREDKLTIALKETIPAGCNVERWPVRQSMVSTAKKPLAIIPSTYVWLFGDSLIGTSSRTKRLEAQMISNSIGLAQMDFTSEREDTRIKSIKYYWGASTVELGEPGPVLDANVVAKAVTDVHPYLNVEHASYWPIDGISVVSRCTFDASQICTRVIILGQLVKPFEHASMGAEAGADGLLDDAVTGLEFDELCIAATVVNNPLEAPDLWHYDAFFAAESIQGGTSFFTEPVPKEAADSKDLKLKRAQLQRKVLGSPRFRWTSTAAATGQRFALESDYIVLLGSYEPPRNTELTSRSDRYKNMFDTFSVLKSGRYQVFGRVRAGDMMKTGFETVEVLYAAPGSQVLRWGQLLSVSALVPHKVLPGSPSEASLFFDSEFERWVVASLELLSGQFSVCYSPSLDITEGPMKCVQDSYTAIGSPWNNSMMYNVYAGKAHPELKDLKSSKLPDVKDSSDIAAFVLSYIPNSRGGPGKLMDEHNFLAYLPKFVHARIRIKT